MDQPRHRTPTPAAARMRRYRRRQRDGVRVVPVEVDHELIEKLIDDGWIGEAEAVDLKRLADAVAKAAAANLP